VTRLTLWAELPDLVAAAHRRFGTPADVLLEPFSPSRRVKADGRAYRGRAVTPSLDLRVHRYHRPRQALSEATIMATFAHELAHLGTWGRESLHHGPKWRALTYEIAAWLRARGYRVSTNLTFGSYPRSRRRK